MNTIRSFIAIESPDEVKDEIVNLQKRLKTLQADVRWEAPQKLHITIKFLGDVNETIQEREMFLSLFTWDLI